MAGITTHLSLLSARAWAGVAAALIALIGVGDYFTRMSPALSVFYLLPISLITWFVGRQGGIVTSAVCAIASLAVPVTNASYYENPISPIWNLTVDLGLFGVTLVVLSTLRDALEHERELARTDSLTGVANNRAFAELVRYELNRAARYNSPFSIAYIDIDNFKMVNDRFGHSAGDGLLREVAATLTGNTRPTDTAARLGGDEFAILLVESDYISAQAAMRRVQRALSDKASERGWPVTFSIGMVTCQDPRGSVDDLLKLADALMYRVKRASKNGMQHELVKKTEQVA